MTASAAKTCANALPPSSRATFPVSQNRYRSGEGWEKAHTDERVTKKMALDPRHERDERWMIDISPIEMLAASEIIKFIPKNSVATSGEEMKKEFRAGEIEDQRRPQEKLRCRSYFHEIWMLFYFRPRSNPSKVIL